MKFDDKVSWDATVTQEKLSTEKALKNWRLWHQTFDLHGRLILKFLENFGVIYS